MMVDHNGWINIREQTPTAADADEWGCVLVWHRYNGTQVTGWHNIVVHENPDGDLITHWRHCPPPPEGSEPHGAD